MMSLTQDQYRFLMANVAGFSLALPYGFVPKNLRNEFNYLPGIFMIYYCFGRQANSLVLYSAASFIICRFTPSRYVQRLTMCSSLAFLSYAHLSRQILDYGGYVLDISGPFMIAVQKMTSLGFCLYDGGLKKREEEIGIEESGVVTRRELDNNNTEMDSATMRLIKSVDSTGSTPYVIDSPVGNKKDISTCNHNLLTDEQRKYAVTNVPRFNEFMGYFFHFPSVMCGPIMYFKDYSEFVSAPGDKKNPSGRSTAVARKLIISIVCALLHLTLNPKFEIEFLRSPEFLIHTPLVMRFYYILIFTMLSRLKYYVAWHLGEAISNTTGFGFNGYDSDGKAKWNLISNMDLVKFETCLNMRDAVHAWNKSTQAWLRRTAYERAPKKLSLVATYFLSAVWHGFYPGYYMTFLGGALFTAAARNGRRIITPLFKRGKVLPTIYDICTFIMTRLTIAYVAFPFVILDFRNSFEIYKSLYFSIHLLALAGVIMGYLIKRK